MKKLLSLILILCMIFVMMIPSFAFANERTITLEAPQKAILGGKINLTFNGELADGETVSYYVNGKETASGIVDVEIVGANTAYAVVKDSNGNTVVKTEEIVFEGVEAIFENAYSVVDMTGAKFASFDVSNSPDGKENIGEFLDLSASENTEDASHGTVAHLKIHGNPGKKSNAGGNNGGSGRRVFANEPYKSANIISFAFDIKVLKMETEPTPYLGVVFDKAYSGFNFEGENLYIATDYSHGVYNPETRITLPMEYGTWHTLQYVFDDNNDLIYHIVDGTVYSAVPFKGSTSTFDLAYEKTQNFYPDFYLRADFESGKECEVYVDNIKRLYSVPPKIEVQAPAYAPVGKNVKLMTKKANTEAYTVGYYVNGKKSDVTGENAEIKIETGGDNVIVAALFNSSGKEIARSEEIKVKGVEMYFDNAIGVFTMDTGARFHDDFKSASNSPDGHTNIAEIVDITDSVDHDDVAHGNVAHLKIHGNPGKNSNAGYSLVSEERNLYSKTPYVNSSTVAFFYDIKVVKMEGEAKPLLGYIADNGYCGFTFSGETLYISTDYSKGASHADTRMSVPFEYNTWHNLGLIFDDENDIIYHLVDGTLYSAISFTGSASTFDLAYEKTRKFYPEFYLRANFESGKECEVYIDNLERLYSVEPTVAISVPAYAPVGSKIEVKAERSNSENLNVAYFVNGKKANVSGDSVLLNITNEGTNKIKACLTDSQGEIVASSEENTVTGVLMNLENARSTFTMDAGASFDDGYKSVANSPNDHTNIAEIVDITDSVDHDDAAHGNAAHLKIHGNPGKNSNAGYSIAQRTVFKNEPYKNADIVSFAFDIKVEKMEAMPKALLGYIADNGYCGFSFEGENLYVSTDYSKGAQDSATRMTIPMKNGTWHTLQYIFDDTNDIIYHLVDGIMYSAVPFAGTSKTFSLADEKARNFYPEFYLRADFDSGKECEVYLDNVKILYGAEFDNSYKNLSVSSGDNLVEAFSDIIKNDGIKITFDVIKYDESELSCVAALYNDSDNSLRGVGVDNISFSDDETTKEVTLIIDSLPDNINSGDYELCLFIWEQDTIKPVMKKVTLIK